jgi:hypothetical protein
MHIECLKATSTYCGAESETVADLLLPDFGLVIRDTRFLHDKDNHLGVVILPREQLIEDGKLVSRDVLQFTSQWDETAFVAMAIKAILAYQQVQQVPR